MTLAHETAPHAGASNIPRHDWTPAEVAALFALPFPELMFRAAQAHRENFDPAEVQIDGLGWATARSAMPIIRITISRRACRIAAPAPSRA